MTVRIEPGQDEIERRYQELYERHGKALEARHRGKFLAISSGGETILGETLRDVAHEAKARFGTGSFVYKVGERSVGRWR
jgi:wyosine [tRNA(Phe)-imidazoG37] synthetase (radical SAM superfamily)